MEIECPRCGPDWREKHKSTHLTLALMRPPENGRLVCMDSDLYPGAKEAGMVW